MRKRNFEIIFNNGFKRQILLLPETPIKIALIFAEKELYLREKKHKEGLYLISHQRGFTEKYEYTDDRKVFIDDEPWPPLEDAGPEKNCRPPDSRELARRLLAKSYERTPTYLAPSCLPARWPILNRPNDNQVTDGGDYEDEDVDSGTAAQNHSVQVQTISALDQTDKTVSSRTTAEQNLSEMQIESAKNSEDGNKDDHVEFSEEDDDYSMDVDNITIDSSDEQDSVVASQKEQEIQKNIQMSSQVVDEREPSVVDVRIVNYHGNAEKSFIENGEKALDLSVSKSRRESDNTDSQIKTLSSLINDQDSSKTCDTEIYQESLLVQNSQNSQESVIVNKSENGQESILVQNSENVQESIVVQNFDNCEESSLVPNSENVQESVVSDTDEKKETVEASDTDEKKSPYKCVLCQKRRTSKRSLHRFPRCCEISRMWALASGKEIILAHKADVRRRRYRVCSEHFNSSDFTPHKSKRLKWSAIPTKNLPKPLPEPSSASQKAPLLPDKNIIANMKSKLKLALQEPKLKITSHNFVCTEPEAVQRRSSSHSSSTHNNLPSSSYDQSTLQTSTLSNSQSVGNPIQRITLNQLLLKAASNMKENSGQKILLFEVITNKESYKLNS